MRVYVCYEVNNTELVMANGYAVANMRVFQNLDKAVEWVKERVDSGITNEEFQPESGYDINTMKADAEQNRIAAVTMEQGDEFSYEIVIEPKEVE